MNRIHLLPDDVVNRIAAGEVVERPASVLKELVENSLDAGATVVKVSFSGAGLEYIEVADDGLGMSPEEMETAVRRFATSKISSYEDLKTITSFGFRGEALPSIASVSKLEIMSRPREANAGWRIRLVGGTLEEREEIQMSPGTVVRVEDLFFNTPARKKFLKSLKSERGHLVSAFLDAAVSVEGVAFELVENGRVLFDFEEHLDFYDRVRRRERELGEHLFDFDEVSPYFRIRGMISGPDRTFPTAGRVKVFVNGRPVKEPVVLAALKEGLRGMIPENRFPAAYIFLEVSPEEVDFNVHPTKREVRFRYSRELFEMVKYSVKKCLESRRAAVRSEVDDRSVSRPCGEGEDGKASAGGTTLWGAVMERGSGYGGGAQQRPAVTEVFETRLPMSSEEIRFVGQVLGNYLLYEVGDMMLIVDLHAASERVVFEELMKRMRGELEGERLLLISIDIPVERLAGWEKEVAEALSSAGCRVEISGGTLSIKGIPGFLEGVDLEELVSDLVDEMGLDWGASAGEEDRMRKIVSTIACHNSLRGREKLEGNEAILLLKNLLELPYGDTCPHGRPVYISVTRERLHRMFGRK